MMRLEVEPICGGCQKSIPSNFRGLTYEQALYQQSYHEDGKLIFHLHGNNARTRDVVGRRAAIYVDYVKKRITSEQFKKAYKDPWNELIKNPPKSAGCAGAFLLVSVLITAALLIRG
jgi:hypothetical protein